MNANVTFKPKCYVFECAGCGLLSCSERSDAVTCSNACRVIVHRSGKAKRLRALAEAYDITPAMIQQGAAIQQLAPELAGELLSGKRRKIDNEVRQVVWARFWERLNPATGMTP